MINRQEVLDKLTHVLLSEELATSVLDSFRCNQIDIAYLVDYPIHIGTGEFDGYLTEDNFGKFVVYFNQGVCIISLSSEAYVAYARMLSYSFGL